MKALQVLFCALLIGVAGCESGRQPENELITVDVTQHYPKKKLVLFASRVCSIGNLG